MGIIPHDDLNYVHQVWDTRLEFATYSDLKNNVGSKLTADTVGLLAKVTADGSLWEHTQFTPYVKTKLIAGSLYGSTYEDVDYYVNTSTGSALNPGTSASPFDDISTALAEIPHVLKHAIHIHIQAAGTYTITKDIYHTASENGQLSIDASQILVDVDVGPYTVNSWTAGGPSGYEYGEIVVAGTPFTPGELEGKLIRGITGTGAGTLVHIMSNTNNTIRLAPYGTGFANSDTFKIVEPGATVTITDGVGIEVIPIGRPANTESSDPCRFCMIGLKSNSNVSLYMKNTNAWIQYCSFPSLSLKVFNSRISDTNPSDFIKAIDEISFRSVWDVSFQTKSLYGSGIRVYQLLCERITLVDYRCSLISTGVKNSGNAVGITTLKGPTINIHNCYINTPTKNAILNYTKINIGYLYIQAASDAILTKSGEIELNNVGGNSSNISGHVLRMANYSRAGLDSVPTVTGSTSTGAIYWEMTSTSQAYPTAGNGFTDSRGNWVSTLQ